MNGYSDYDYLCNEHYSYDGIGHIKCPTLREIRYVTYNQFNIFLNYISITQKQFLDTFGLIEKYDSLPEEEKKRNTIFNLLTFGMNRADFLAYLIDFFVVEDVQYDQEHNAFLIGTFDTNDDGNEVFNVVGKINDENFDDFRKFVELILGLKSDGEVEKPKYKNKLAEKIAKKLAKHNEEKKEKQTSVNENYTLPNMIMKYCTHNKVGINILNVWDMTYYQFMKMFLEYRVGRQADINDMMATNSFSFKNSKDYKPMEYMNKIK